MKKTDFFTMVFQFLGAGIIFFFASIENYSNPLIGKVIYPLEFLRIYMGFPLEIVGILIIFTIGIFGLIVQRKMYIRQQIKKSIEPYKK